jgi:hypothetical protein
MVEALRALGRSSEAHAAMLEHLPDIVKFAEPGKQIIAAEDFAVLLAEKGDVVTAARLIGSADALRERLNYARFRTYDAQIGRPMAAARRTLAAGEWDRAYRQGRQTPLAQALTGAWTAATQGSATS